MADGTKIEWCDATWNPIVGCSVLSPGCTNCYAMRQAPRTDALSLGAPWAGNGGPLTQQSKAGPVWTGAVRLVERRLNQPLRWRRPRKIFVNSMGDLFHENVPDEWIDRVFAVMGLAPQHTFQVLTKRAERMRTYLTDRTTPKRILSALVPLIAPKPRKPLKETVGEALYAVEAIAKWPLHNVWAGVSVEDQARADERIPLLIHTPAAKRFISAEPLLGAVDISHFFLPPEIQGDMRRCLDWVIAGGESGHRARPMHPDWARSLRDQCVEAGAPFHFKQHGEFVSVSEVEGAGPHHHFPDGATVRRVGKHAAGRTLDGREWAEFPA